MMTAGWVLGVCRDGEKEAGTKIGRTRWVARGGIGVSATGGGKASSLGAEVGGMAAVMSVLVAVVERLGGEATLPAVTHYCDNQALTKEVRRRLHVDSRQLRRSAAWGWWAEVTRGMSRWRGRGGRWCTEWRRGHPERHIRDPALWLDADRGIVAADGERGRARRTQTGCGWRVCRGMQCVCRAGRGIRRRGRSWRPGWGRG